MGLCLHHMLFGHWIVLVLSVFISRAEAFVPFQHACFAAITSASNGKVALVRDPNDYNRNSRIRTVHALVDGKGIESDNDQSTKKPELSPIQSFASSLLKTLPTADASSPSSQQDQPKEQYKDTLDNMASEIVNDIPIDHFSDPEVQDQTEEPQGTSMDYSSVVKSVVKSIVSKLSWSAPDPSKKDDNLFWSPPDPSKFNGRLPWSPPDTPKKDGKLSRSPPGTSKKNGKLPWSPPDTSKKDSKLSRSPPSSSKKEETTHMISNADDAQEYFQRIHNTSLVGPLSAKLPKRLYRDLKLLRAAFNGGVEGLVLPASLFHKVMRAWIKKGRHDHGPLMAWTVHKEMIELYESKKQLQLRPTPKSYLILLTAYQKGRCPPDLPTPDLLVDEMLSFGISNVTEAVFVFEAAAASIARAFPYNPSRMKKLLRTYQSSGFPPNANLLSKQLFSATAASIRNSTTAVLGELMSMTIQSQENLRIPIETYHRILRTAIGTDKATSKWALDLFYRMGRNFENGGMGVQLNPQTFEIMLEIAEKCQDPNFGAYMATSLLRPLQAFVWQYWRDSRPASGQIFQLHVHFFNALLEILVRNAKTNSFRDIFQMADRLNSLSKTMETIAKREGKRPAVASSSSSTHRVLIRALSQVDSPAAGKLSEAALRSYMSIRDPHVRRKSVEPFEDVVLAHCNNTREGTLHAEKLLEEAEHLYAKGVLLQAPSVEVYYQLCHSAMQSNTTDHVLKYVSKVWKKIEKGESFSDPPLFIYDFCIREHCKLGLPGCAARLVDKVMREARSGKAWLIPSEATLSLVQDALKAKGMEKKYPVEQYRQWVVKNADKLRLMSQCQADAASPHVLPETSSTHRRVRNRRATYCTFR